VAAQLFSVSDGTFSLSPRAATISLDNDLLVDLEVRIAMAPIMTCGVCNDIALKWGDPSAAPRHCELKQILVRHRSGPHR
jgi:hypothetical protein